MAWHAHKSIISSSFAGDDATFALRSINKVLVLELIKYSHVICIQLQQNYSILALKLVIVTCAKWHNYFLFAYLSDNNHYFAKSVTLNVK
jgi:hypothetical protein